MRILMLALLMGFSIAYSQASGSECNRICVVNQHEKSPVQEGSYTPRDQRPACYRKATHINYCPRELLKHEYGLIS